MTAFDSALDSGGDLLAAWDFEDNDRERWVLHRVGASGAKELAETSVPAAMREDFVDGLVARGVRIGAMYGGTPFTWVVDEQGVAVWSETACIARCTGRVESATRVHVWLGENRGHRGVSIDAATEIVIAEERRSSHLMITYGQDDLYYETFWAHYLGLHVALWHGVPLVNDITPQDTIDDDLRVYAATRALADDVGAGRERMVGAIGRAESLTLGITEEAVGVRVGFRGATLTRLMKRGDPQQLAAFLRRVTTPSVVLTAMNTLINEHCDLIRA